MYRYLSEQELMDITSDEATTAIRKTSIWKSSGIENVQKCWLKNCGTLHEDIARCYNKMEREPEETPTRLTQGVMYLLPKTQEIKVPKTIDRFLVYQPSTKY